MIAKTPGFPYKCLHEVAETHEFLRAAKFAGLTEDDRHEIAWIVSNDPTIGDELKGTGGCRKFRWASPGTGKSGGYRIITFFSGLDIPVYLLTVFAKNVRTNITPAEANKMSNATKLIVQQYRNKRTRSH